MDQRDLVSNRPPKNPQCEGIKGQKRLAGHALTLSRRLLQFGQNLILNQPCLMCGSLIGDTLISRALISRISINSHPNPNKLARNPSAHKICGACQSYLVQSTTSCQRCGIALNTPYNDAHNNIHDNTAIHCGMCLKNPPTFDSTFSPYIYTAPLNKLISQFKHGGNDTIGKELGRLFSSAINNHYRERHINTPRWIIPVPLHWTRQWHRGFNQAAFLAKEIVNSPACVQSNTQLFYYVKKRRATTSQEQLSRRERLNNTKNTFIVTQALKGESVAIVDDVMTTGATVGSLAKSLKKAGAGKVTVWALARTPMDV
ncbi:MAG: ComF family protein [Cellvibrionaceae bacterium]